MAKTKFRMAAVVLAAGSSERMGAQNKLHLPVNGVPLLLHSLETLLTASIDEIVVVLGHEHEATQALLDGLSVRSVYNPDHLSGQMSSVHCGLAALGAAPESEYDGIIIALGDQPALRVADINYLIEAFRRREDVEVIVPAYQGQRGNPIIISAQTRTDILAGTRNLGCRKFIENNPELVQMIEMSNAAVIIDLDTPQQYENYCQSRKPQEMHYG